MAAQLVIVPPKDSKPKREQIGLIEAPPREDWFVPARTSRGRCVWYLRVLVTGLNNRLNGPFPSKRQGLLFLDDMLGRLLERVSEAENDCSKRMVRDEFQKVWSPIVEHPILAQSEAHHERHER